jgi:hypothetical protein
MTPVPPDRKGRYRAVRLALPPAGRPDRDRHVCRSGTVLTVPSADACPGGEHRRNLTACTGESPDLRRDVLPRHGISVC